MADQYSLTDEEKEYALVKAYEQHGERLAKSEEVCGSGQDELLRSPPRPIRPKPPCPMALQIRRIDLERLWSFSATPGPKPVDGAVRASKWIWSGRRSVLARALGP